MCKTEKLSKSQEKRLFEIFTKTIKEYFKDKSEEKSSIISINSEIIYFGDIIKNKEYKIKKNEKGDNIYIY